MKAYRVEAFGCKAEKFEITAALVALTEKLNREFNVLRREMFRTNRSLNIIEQDSNDGWTPLCVEISEFNL